MTKQNEEAKVTLVNAGKLTLKTRAGDFGPQGKISVSPQDAARLLKYPGIMRASDYKPEDHVADTARIAELEAKNAELQNQLDAAATGDTSEIEKTLDDAHAALKAAQERIAELEAANEKLTKENGKLEKKLEKAS